MDKVHSVCSRCNVVMTGMSGNISLTVCVMSDGVDVSSKLDPRQLLWLHLYLKLNVDICLGRKWLPCLQLSSHKVRLWWLLAPVLLNAADEFMLGLNKEWVHLFGIAVTVKNKSNFPSNVTS